MNDDRYWDLMSKYVSRDLSIEETEELLTWLDDDPERANMLKELTDTWAVTKNYPENFDVDTQAGWNRLKNALGVEEKAKPISAYTLIGVAASLILVAFTAFWFYSNLNESDLINVATSSGESKELVLPDGSKIWINQNSLISYSANFNSDNSRDVKLAGEAFFDVAKNPDKPFQIETSGTIVRVLGTSFNVRQDEVGSINVAVVSGKVSFQSGKNPKKQLILLPGDAGTISKEGYAEKVKLENQNFLFWKNRQLDFVNATLSEVLKTIENSYHINFQLDDENLRTHRITTSFNQSSLTEVINVLEVLLDLKIEKTDSIYVVKKEQ